MSDAGGAIADYKKSPGLGIICVLESKPSSKLQAWLAEDKVVSIFERTDDATKIRTKDVLVLVNFLHYVTWRYRMQGSGPSFPQMVITPT